MTEVVSVRFKNGGKSYFFDPGNITVEPGTNVIVETSKGLEFGECVRENYWVEDDKIVPPLRSVVRLADNEDIEAVEANKAKEAQAYDVCSQKIEEHNLDMKLVNVEYNFEGNKIMFFFTADGRVDFRDLVKDLAAIFRTRIELRQIGVRDEAKMLGGLGICGRPFCCNQFLDEFQPVSIKMAKTQSLSLNPTKISGTCGRLMCCLKYEQDAYESLVKNAPKMDSYVETPEGRGTITDVNLLRQRVKVRMDTKNNEAVIETFSVNEVNFIKTGKQHRADVLSGVVEEPLESKETKQTKHLKNMKTETKLEEKLVRAKGEPKEPRAPRAKSKEENSKNNEKNTTDDKPREQRNKKPRRQNAGKKPENSRPENSEKARNQNEQSKKKSAASSEKSKKPRYPRRNKKGGGGGGSGSGEGGGKNKNQEISNE